MINNKNIKVKINHANRKKYEERLGLDLKNGETITINQVNILESSRIEVECTCDNCGKIFQKRRTDIKNNITLCGIKCRNENFTKINPNPKKDKVKVNCCVCHEEFEIFESKFKKQNVFICSRDCYKKHRSITYNGDQLYNYQDIKVSCEMCGNDVKTSKWYLENKNHIFCTQDCYWEHRKTYYKEFYYNDSLNNSRAETNPERMVREWLEYNGFIKNQDFYQECGFLKKYYVDFYIPKYKIIIEVYGDYWHVNPDVYDVFNNNKLKKPLNSNRQEFVDSNHDNIRNLELESYGYKVYILWEKDIIGNLNEHIEKIFVNLKNK